MGWGLAQLGTITSVQELMSIGRRWPESRRRQVAGDDRRWLVAVVDSYRWQLEAVALDGSRDHIPFPWECCFGIFFLPGNIPEYIFICPRTKRPYLYPLDFLNRNPLDSKCNSLFLFSVKFFPRNNLPRTQIITEHFLLRTTTTQ